MKIRRIATWLAFGALFLQAFWPLAAAASMARAQDGPTLTLCTAQGLIDVSVDAPGGSPKPVPLGSHHIPHCPLCCQGIHLSGILPAVQFAVPRLAQERPSTAPFMSSVLLFFGVHSPPRGPPSIA